MAKADLHNVTDDWGSASLQQDRASADWIGSTQDAIVESLQFIHDSVSWGIADHGTCPCKVSKKQRIGALETTDVKWCATIPRREGPNTTRTLRVSVRKLK